MGQRTTHGRLTAKSVRRALRRYRFADRCVRIGATDTLRYNRREDLPGGWAWPRRSRYASDGRRWKGARAAAARYDLDVLQREALYGNDVTRRLVGLAAAFGLWDRVEALLRTRGVCTDRHIELAKL